MYASDLKHPASRLTKKLQTLYNLSRSLKIDPGFRPPYLYLLEKLGNPHLNLPPVIHVAGTNGKGSTIAFLRAMMENQGYDVHTYTSPHLIRFNERIGLASKDIDDDHLEALIDEALALNAGREITFFEITSALAFKAFAETQGDILLLEVGMGGRLDCTNVIESPLACVITQIGYDHMAFLGNSIAQIAAEKAGIIKPGAPVILGRQRYDEAAKIIEETAKFKNAHFFRARNQPFPDPVLTGPHQRENAATAWAVLDAVKKDFPVPEKNRVHALGQARWPGRLQKLSINAGPHEVWLDGGHNESAGQALARQAQLWREDGKSLYVILGMMKGKEPRQFIEPLEPYIDELHLTGLPGEPDFMSPAQLQAKLETHTAHIHLHLHPDCKTALRHIQNKAEQPGRILITGSLYLAGHVLGAL